MEKSDPVIKTTMICSICNNNYEHNFIFHMECCYENVKANGATGEVKCDGCNKKMNVIEYPLHRLIEVTSAKQYSQGRRCKFCACALSSGYSLLRHHSVFHPDLYHPEASNQPGSTATVDAIQTNLSKNQSVKNVILSYQNLQCSICETFVGFRYNDHLENCYTVVKVTSRNDSVLCDCCNEQVKVIDYPIHRLEELTNNEKFSGKVKCKSCKCRFHNNAALYKHYNVFHPDNIILPATPNQIKSSKTIQQIIQHREKHQLLKRKLKTQNALRRPSSTSRNYSLSKSINHSTENPAATSLATHPIASPPEPLANSSSKLQLDSHRNANIDLDFNVTGKYNPVLENITTCSICNMDIGPHYNTHLQNCYEAVKNILPVKNVDCDGCGETLRITDYPIHRLRELTTSGRFKGRSICRQRHCGCRFTNSEILSKHFNVFHSTNINSSSNDGQIHLSRSVEDPQNTKRKALKRKRDQDELTQQQIEKSSHQSPSQYKRSLISPSFSPFPSNSSTPSSVEPLQSAASSEVTLHNELSMDLSPSGLSSSQSLVTPPHLNKKNPRCGFCNLKIPLQQFDHVARCHDKYVTKRSKSCSELVNCTICKGKVHYQKYALHFHREFCKIREEECPLKCDKCGCTFKEKLTLRLHSILHRPVQ